LNSAPTGRIGQASLSVSDVKMASEQGRADKEWDERDHAGLSRRSIGTGVLVTCRVGDLARATAVLIDRWASAGRHGSLHRIPGAHRRAHGV
jgi:hypothetical protein